MSWLIKTEHGYMLEDDEGNIEQFFDMACNSKAYCMEKEIVPIYLHKKSPNLVKEIYKTLTGKTLWWETE